VTSAQADLAQPRRRSRARFTPRAAILAVIVVLLLLYLAVPFRSYLTQRNRLAQLEHQSTLLEQQNSQLQQQIQQLQDPKHIEQVARECLGMVKKGEIGFVVVPKSGQAAPVSC
jgi:cell division protein FtsL